MKFNFTDFGGVDNGSIELGDLTIIAGPNNVGKTYISYAIFGILVYFKRLCILNMIGAAKEHIGQLRQDGAISINLQEYQKQLSEHLNNVSKSFTESLDQFYNVNEEYFSKSKFEIVPDDSFLTGFEKEYKRTIQFGESIFIILHKGVQDSTLTVTLEKSQSPKLTDEVIAEYISSGIVDCLFADIIPMPFVVTSERTGISLFYKELDITKNSILEHITNSETVNPIQLLNSMRSRYAEPIKFNIDIIREYDNILKSKSFIKEDQNCECKAIKSILHEIVGGAFKLQDKQVVFVPKKERNREKTIVPFYLSSSSTKSLFLIDLYINSLAIKNGILIIDEPELNLHPDNQCKIALLLARLVNCGIKVVITTHSDYIVRQINNCIRLNRNLVNKERLMKKYKFDKLDILQPAQVKGYVLKDHSIYQMTVSELGLDTDVFDSIIRNANQAMNDIYFADEV